jgi:hypothetical protein
MTLAIYTVFAFVSAKVIEGAAELYDVPQYQNRMMIFHAICMVVGLTR